MDILIIEDEILIQQSLSTLLKRKGAKVTATANGLDAIQLINDKSYDRIICDLMLQDISGFDIIESSKEKYSPEEIKNKFIIITAYSSDQVITKASSYGCRLLNKPFDNINEAINIFLGTK